MVYNDTNHRALVDTGATGSCVNYNILKSGTLYEETPGVVAKLAAEQSVPIEGTISLTVYVGTHCCLVTCSIIKNLSAPLILGNDWLKEYKVSIDYDSEKLFYGSSPRESIPFVYRNVNQYQGTFNIKLEDIPQELPEEFHERLMNVLQEFPQVFNTDNLQQTNSARHSIALTNYHPIFTKPYKLSPEKQEFVQKQVSEMLAQNLIEPSESPYNSQIVVVNYNDNSREPRFCINYKKLNDVTIDQNCPVSNIHDIIKNLGAAKVFCKVDLRKGYWQIPLSAEAKPFTAFTTPDGGHYQFKVMPFGLKGAPATFIRLMHQTLAGLIGKIAEVYLDDIIIYADTYPELLDNLQKVLQRLNHFKLTAHLKKCLFGTQDITYLGHRVTDAFNGASEAHIKAIAEYPSPTTKKQLRSFLGTCNWLREFVPHAADVLDPLYSTLNKKPFKWTTEDESKLKEVKEAFAKTNPLYRPDMSKPFILQTDASGVGLGATLYQMDGEQRRIIANISTSLNNTERSYSSNEKECFAVVWACKRFRPYLESKKFTLRTDNRALLWLKQFRDERSKLMRWSLSLQELSFNVEHVPGKTNQLPDALSRQPMEEETKDEIDDIMFPIQESSPEVLEKPGLNPTVD